MANGSAKHHEGARLSGTWKESVAGAAFAHAADTKALKVIIAA